MPADDEVTVDPRRVVVGWGLAGLTGLLVLAGALGWAARGAEGDPAAFLLIALGFGVPGILLTATRRGGPVGNALLVVAAATAALLATGAHQAAGGPGALWSAWLASWVWAAGVTTALVVLPHLLPDGRLPSPRWRAVRTAAVGTSAAYCVVLAIRPGPLEGSEDRTNPVGLDMAGLLSGAELMLTIALAVLALLGLASLVAHWRSGDRRSRRQLEWLLLAVVLLLGFYVLAPLLPFSDVLAPVAVLLLPAGIVAGVLGHGLYDVDRLLVRTIVAASLTGLVLAASVVLAALAGAAVDDETRVTRAAIVTGLVAVAFSPLRSRLQRLVNRGVHGHDDDPLTALRRLGERLAVTSPPDELLREVVDVVASELRAPYVAVDLLRDDRVVRSARRGEPSDDVIVLPVRHHDELVAELVLRPRGGGQLDRRGRQVLEELLRSAAPALHAAVLSEDLRRSREQLVVAREEERRRLRRDLHDGLGALLSGLSMSVAAAEQSEPDPVRRAELGRVTRGLDDTRTEVRRLIDDLRPRDLDELGLAAALRVVAEQVGSRRGGPRVDVEVLEPLGPLASDVEVAAYRIVSEAVTNAVRHSAAGHVHVLVQRDGDLLLQVTDDGTGLAPDDVPGVGLRSMRERAAELGGSCVVRNDEPGTLVQVVLPVQR